MSQYSIKEKNGSSAGPIEKSAGKDLGVDLKSGSQCLANCEVQGSEFGRQGGSLFHLCCPTPTLDTPSAQPEPCPQQVEGHSLSSTSLAVGYGAKYTHPKERQTECLWWERTQRTQSPRERDLETHRLNTEWGEETCMPRDAMSMYRCVRYCSHLREGRERNQHTQLIPRLGRDTKTLCLSCPRLGDTDNWMKGREWHTSRR